MEISAYIAADAAAAAFKSHYVVWKFLWITIIIFLMRSFKSHYVVWKLEKKFRASEPLPSEFKSHYVVWKLCIRSSQPQRE